MINPLSEAVSGWYYGRCRNRLLAIEGKSPMIRSLLVVTLMAMVVASCTREGTKCDDGGDGDGKNGIVIDGVCL